jgi:NADP-dependent 3-hydroxy acid dehydrogenase YdfG
MNDNNIEGKVVIIIITGAVAADLPKAMTDPDTAELVRKAYEFAVPAESFAQAVAFAISQPEDVLMMLYIFV